MRWMLVLMAGACLAVGGAVFAPTEAPPGSAGGTQPGGSLASAISDFADTAIGRDPADDGAKQASGAADRGSQAPTQTYWQYVENGKVKFVSSRDDVPEQWRARAGRVQMAGPPPGSPAEAN